jgi:hypothetical protein
MVLVGDRRVGFDFLFGESTRRPFGFSKLELVNRISSSWNLISGFLQRIERLRHAA